MPARGPTAFYVEIRPDGSLHLRGELDVATVQDLQDKIDEILVSGQPIILDLAQLMFLDSSAIHCFIRTCEASRHPVVLLNTTSTVRRILDFGMPDSEAWMFEGQGPVV
jgi:anti-anti-sigma factor